MITVLDSLLKWCEIQPTKNVWVFLNDKNEIVDSYTYQELDAASSFLSDQLLNQYMLHEGDRVLLVFFPGLDFTVSLLACLKASLIAVPVFPPDPRKMKKDLHHFVNIQSSCGSTTVLTNSLYNFTKKLEGLKNIFSTSDHTRWPDLKWIVVDDLLKKGKSMKNKANNDKSLLITNDNLQDKIAFLQYTSGSTSDPKGVMITHQNLAHNLTLIITELKANTQTINVSWLPQYHDMGLIGSYLGAMYCGGTGYYLSPISFLKDPIVWIKAISQYKGTHTQAPNFAYALVTRKFKEAMKDETFQNKIAKHLNLSTLQHMINAAEPVDYHAIMDFYDIFGKYGLPNHVIIPTYGLAEHTVFVCSGGKQVLSCSKTSLESGIVDIIGNISILEGGNILDDNIPLDSKEIQRIIGCGYPDHGDGVRLVIVNSNEVEHDKESQGHNNKLTILPEKTIGEIWVTSPSKAQGYWNQPELSKHDFHASIEELSDQNAEYLRTGDLGFMYNGELFICGRLKDLIIVRGSNHYPQDIERTAENVQSETIRAGCSAAFSLLGNTKRSTEDVAYVAELKDGIASSNYASIAESIRDTISANHGLALSVICLLKPRSIPKTTSGKIARAWCRRGLYENTLQIVYRLDGDVNATTTINIIEKDINDDETMNTVNNTKKGYESITSDDQVEIIPNRKNHQTVEQVRDLSISEIVTQLEDMLIQVAKQGPTPLSLPIDTTLPISMMGLDSMTLVQFKGVLEKKFYTDIPDEFLFTTLAYVDQLALAVKLGHLTDEQQYQFDNHSSSSAIETTSNGTAHPHQRSATEVVAMKQPCCPWFTCCL